MSSEVTEPKKNNWIQNWTDPPNTIEEFSQWKIYMVVWKDANMTPAGMIVNTWLKKHGVPTGEDEFEWYEPAVRAFMFSDGKLRHA